MRNPSPCPTVDRLSHLLSAPDQALPGELAAHVGECPRCQAALERVALADQAWLSSAVACGLTGRSDSAALERVLRRLKDPATTSGFDGAAGLAARLSFLAPCDHPEALGALGPYPILGVVGEGGMGLVLKAIDPSLRRVLAIKALSLQLAASGPARRRFLKEAEAMAAVAHQHIVSIHAVADSGGLPYLVMEYVPGGSLQARLQRHGPLSALETVRVGLQAAEGLAAAHAQGLVHRDIKPANILLDAGVCRIRITDFGLARAVDDAGGTQAGAIVGTPEYMAPEQASGGAADARSDLFSLGAVLYACCAGFSPFRASTSLAAIHLVTQASPRPIRELNPETPAELARVIERLLEKDPASRWQSARETADELQALLHAMLQPEPRSGPPAALGPSSARWTRPVVGLLALAVIVAVWGAGWALREQAPGDAPPERTTSAAGQIPAGPVPPDELPQAPLPTERLTLAGHTRPVRGLAVDPSSQTLVSSSGWPEGDGTIRVWSLAAGQLTKTIRVAEPGAVAIDALALVPQSSRILAGLGDGRVLAYSWLTGEQEFERQAGPQGINGIAVSPDGTLFATAGDEGAVQLARTDTGEPVHSFSAAHAKPCRSVAFAKHGATLASGGLDGFVRLWNVKDGSLVREIETKHGDREVWAVAFVDGGQTVVAAGDGATAFDVASGAFRWHLPGHARASGNNVTDLAVSADERQLATCGYDGSFCVWKLTGRKPLWRGDAGVGIVWKVAFTPDSRLLLTGGGGEFEGGRCLPGQRFSIRGWALDPLP